MFMGGTTKYSNKQNSSTALNDRLGIREMKTLANKLLSDQKKRHQGENEKFTHRELEGEQF